MRDAKSVEDIFVKLVLELIFWLGWIEVDNIDELEGVGEILLLLGILDGSIDELEIFTWEILAVLMTVDKTVKLLFLSAIAEDVNTIIFVVSICIDVDVVSICVDIDIGIDTVVAEIEFEREIIGVKDLLSVDELEIELESFIEVVISIIEGLLLSILETSDNIVVASIFSIEDPSWNKKEFCVAAPPIKMFKILK